MNIRSSAIAVLLVAALALQAAGFAEKRSYPRYDRQLTKKEDRWVRQTLGMLNLNEKIGQMITVNTNAVFMNRESEEYKQLLHQVLDNRIGGLILSRSQVWAAAVLTNRLQEIAKVPLLVSADLEMGPGMRLDDTTWWPSNMALAATGDVNYARLQGSYTARQARAAGINWLYAPVADVNSNPKNPVINIRSYGEDPDAVAAFASAFIEGAQAAGAIATAKHFPGHGDAAIDSHIGLPVIDIGRQRLEQLELVPFRAAIAHRVGSIMTAHIALPQIDPESLPATLSPKILTGVLREELSFRGLIVTDAMEMAGVAARYDPGTAAVLAVKAGADVILKTPDIDAVIAALKQAVARGEIPESRINASVERILHAKAALGLNERREVDLNEVDRVVSDPQFNAIAQEIADRSITLVRDEQKYVPLRRRPLLAVTLTDEENRGIMDPFIAELRRVGAQAEVISLDNRSTNGDLEVVRSRLAENTGDIVYCIAVRDALPPLGIRVTADLNNAEGRVTVISFGNPYLLEEMPHVPAYLAAYGPYPVSQRAAAKALLGEIDIRGKLPVTLPGLYPRGHGVEVKRSGGGKE